MIVTTNANESLFPVIQSLAHRIWPHTFGNILSNDQIAYMLEWMYSVQSIKDQVEEKGHQYILALKDEDYIGYASFEINYNKTTDTKLHKIYVLPEFQGKGAGKVLMDEVIKRTAEAGNKNLLLNVNRDNPALDFYKNRGFEIIRVEDIDIGNGYYMNDYVMRLKSFGVEVFLFTFFSLVSSAICL
ncbi:MAG: GNAT family N-acetyltransferase [Bacteroidales bacterium]|nr:GNAT family N-acetyltransferase [Bacteroidales bacterium]